MAMLRLLFFSHTINNYCYLNSSVNIYCLFTVLTGTFFRHLEKGGKNEETTESASLQESALATNSTTSDLSTSDNDNELSEPDEQRPDGLSS